MAIILRTVLSGPKGSFQPGRHDSFTADEERDLVAGWYAEYVVAPPERAVTAPVERAVVAQTEQRRNRRGR